MAPASAAGKREVMVGSLLRQDELAVGGDAQPVVLAGVLEDCLAAPAHELGDLKAHRTDRRQRVRGWRNGLCARLFFSGVDQRCCSQECLAGVASATTVHCDLRATRKARL